MTLPTNAGWVNHLSGRTFAIARTTLDSLNRLILISHQYWQGLATSRQTPICKLQFNGLGILGRPKLSIVRLDAFNKQIPQIVTLKRHFFYQALLNFYRQI